MFCNRISLLKRVVKTGVWGIATPCARTMAFPVKDATSDINELIKLIAQDVRENANSYRLTKSTVLLDPESPKLPDYVGQLEDLLALAQARLIELDLSATSQVFDGINYLEKILKQKDTSPATICFQRAALETVKTVSGTLKGVDQSALNQEELRNYDWLTKKTENLLRDHGHLLAKEPAHVGSSPELK